MPRHVQLAEPSQRSFELAFVMPCHAAASFPSARRSTPRCLCASACDVNGTNWPSRYGNRGSLTLMGAPLSSYATPVTAAFAFFLMPSLQPDTSS
eukprot:3986374-Prymnesium_polylepis.1